MLSKPVPSNFSISIPFVQYKKYGDILSLSLPHLLPLANLC